MGLKQCGLMRIVWVLLTLICEILTPLPVLREHPPVEEMGEGTPAAEVSNVPTEASQTAEVSQSAKVPQLAEVSQLAEVPQSAEVSNGVARNITSI